MKKVKVDGHVNLLKDLETGAVISARSNEYDQYVNLKNAKEQESRKIDFMYSHQQGNQQLPPADELLRAF